MEELLNEIVPQDDLERFEKKYHQELDEVSHDTKFGYAFCLVRSRYTNDINKGILLLEELARSHPEGRRDYIYYLAFGNTRVKQYQEAIKYCKAFLEIEPNNDQVQALERHIKMLFEKEYVKGVAVVGGAALILGGILGIGFALAKK